MSKLKDNIPLFSPFTNFVSEFEDEINSSSTEDNELISDIVNNNDRFFEDETESSDSDNYYYESELEFENDSETENEQYSEKEEIIEVLEQSELTVCVVIDFINNKIQRCNQNGKRPLHNLFGTWQVDRDAIKEANGILSKLGVCDTHFQFDNKYLHNSMA
jgi:hypothetical protein